MCDICLHTPCLSQCPNADEPKPAKVCAWCEAELFVGDDVYIINDDDICPDCIASCRTTIEEEEPDDNE